jgi:SWI/SNF-related matrix-associated actin-dependent regulator of chromatin subfamily A protein 2/4
MKYTDAEGRILSQPFMKLPTRKELPDYYEVIKKPIDINKILQRLQADKYMVNIIRFLTILNWDL